MQVIMAPNGGGGVLNEPLRQLITNISKFLSKSLLPVSLSFLSDTMILIHFGKYFLFFLLKRIKVNYDHHVYIPSWQGYFSTYRTLRKYPPNNRKGIIIGGPIDKAMDKVDEAQDIIYPERNKNVSKFFLKTNSYRN